MPKTCDIVSKIAAAIPPARPGNNLPWWERVPPKHAATVDAIHAAWHRGEFGSRKITAARIIATALGELGITIGEQGVIKWLKLPPKS